jgi:hypothetical protein
MLPCYLSECDVAFAYETELGEEAVIALLLFHFSTSVEFCFIIQYSK